MIYCHLPKGSAYIIISRQVSLVGIVGSGSNNRITQADVDELIAAKLAKSQAVAVVVAPAPVATKAAPTAVSDGTYLDLPLVLSLSQVILLLVQALLLVPTRVTCGRSLQRVCCSLSRPSRIIT